jgi:hypothetical protein
MVRIDKPDYEIKIGIKNGKVISIVYGKYFKYEKFKNHKDAEKIMKRNLKLTLKMIKRGGGKK